MTRRSQLVALAAVFALTGDTVIVAAQQRPSRVSDEQVRDLLSCMDTGVEDVLGRASLIDGFLTRHSPDGAVYRHLTGTYQLESGRGDDPGQAADRATRTLPSYQRPHAHQRLMNRLNAPETIAIDRNENSVTMASSRGERLTFEADGQVRTEQGSAGRTVKTRATLYGDRLVVTTTGSRGNDFSVSFEPIDNGRTLRVTRRLYDDNLRQPLTVQSFYRKSSDEAQWDIYSTNQGAPSWADSAAGDVVEFCVKQYSGATPLRRIHLPAID
jgi:hypothetical protein